MKRREPDQEQASRTGEKMREGAQHGTNRLKAFLSNQVEARKVTEEESNHPEMINSCDSDNDEKNRLHYGSAESDLEELDRPDYENSIGGVEVGHDFEMEALGNLDGHDQQEQSGGDSAHENIAHNFLAKLDRNYSCGPKLIVRGEYLGKSNGADYKLVVRRRPEGTYVDWGLFNLKTKKQKLLVREGVKKNKDFFGTLSQTMGRWVQRWFQSPKLFSENNHSVIFTANIQKCPKTCNT